MSAVSLIVIAGVAMSTTYNVIAPEAQSKLINAATRLLVIGMMICMYWLGRMSA